MISKYADHNLHHWINLIQQTRLISLYLSLSSLFSSSTTSFLFTHESVHIFFFFLFSYLFGSLMFLQISLSLYQKFLSILSPLHHHTAGPHVRHHHALLIPSQSSPPSPPSRSSPSPPLSLSLYIFLLVWVLCKLVNCFLKKMRKIIKQLISVGPISRDYVHYDDNLECFY